MILKKSNDYLYILVRNNAVASQSVHYSFANLIATVVEVKMKDIVDLLAGA